MNNDGSENNGEKNTLKIFTEMTDLNKIINLQAAAERKTRRRKKNAKILTLMTFTSMCDEPE